MPVFLVKAALTSSSAFFIDAAAKTVKDCCCASDRRYRAGGDDDDGRDGGTNKKLEHIGAPCVAQDARRMRALPGDLVVFLNDRGRKRRSSGRRHAYGVHLGRVRQPNRRSPAKAMCRQPHGHCPELRGCGDSGGERGTVLGLVGARQGNRDDAADRMACGRERIRRRRRFDTSPSLP